MIRKKASKKKVQKKIFKKKVYNRGLNKNLVINVVVIVLLLIGVFWYFNNQKEVGLSPEAQSGDGQEDVVVRGPVVHYSFDSKTIGSYSKVKNEIPSLPWMVHESGTPSFIQGERGSALKLQGDKVKIINNPGLKDLLSNNEFALSFWIKDITTVSIQKKKGREGFRVNTDRDGNLKFNTFGEKNYQAVVCPIDSSDWKHVIITAESGGSKSMYINGVKCAESQEAGIFNSNPTNNVRIVGNFLGIDDIKMWNRDFSPENALAAFQGNDPSGIVVKYSFGELEGDFDSNVIIKNEIAKLPELLEESGTLSFVEGHLGTTGLNLKVEDGLQDKVKSKHSDGLKKLLSQSEITLSFFAKNLKDLSIQKRTEYEGFVIFGNANVIRFKVGTAPAVICNISPVVDSDIREEEIHVAVTARRNGDAIVYINGVECASGDAGPAKLNARNNLRMRGELDLDEVEIWNYVLTDEEIAEKFRLARGTPPNFKVAFIADASIGFWKEGRILEGSNARGVLQLIKDEGAEMVLYQGDLGYGVETNIAVVETFESQINDILGENFPIFWSIGNHDVGNWYREGGYQDKMEERMARIDGVSCSGDLGVKSACKYKGLFWVFVAPGVLSRDATNYADYITEQLDADDSLWSICSWHKNQGKMQISFLSDETGWGVYESCREEGGIVATGHAHSYSRTHLMKDFSEQSIASTSNTLEIEKGKTFAFVSGLGGANFHGKQKSGYWWASIYTRGGRITTSIENRDLFGALFCTFHVDGQPNKADCYFKNIKGEVIDEFSLISRIN